MFPERFSSMAWHFLWWTLLAEPLSGTGLEAQEDFLAPAYLRSGFDFLRFQKSPGQGISQPDVMFFSWCSESLEWQNKFLCLTGCQRNPCFHPSDLQKAQKCLFPFSEAAAVISVAALLGAAPTTQHGVCCDKYTMEPLTPLLGVTPLLWTTPVGEGLSGFKKWVLEVVLMS